MVTVKRSLLLALACIFTATPEAFASPYDNMYTTANYFPTCDSSTFCMTDNATLTWFTESSLSTQTRLNVDYILENSFEPTDLSVSIEDPPVYSGSAETDIIYRKTSLPPGVLGQTWCENAVTSVKCDQHYIDLADYVASYKVICHESGHAVGLTHGLQASPSISNGDDRLGCMQTPISEITDWVLGTNNIDQINATY